MFLYVAVFLFVCILHKTLQPCSILSGFAYNTAFGGCICKTHFKSLYNEKKTWHMTQNIICVNCAHL